MITTQKLILTVFLINMLVGMTVDIAENPEVFTSTQIDTETSIIESHEEYFEDEEGWLNTVKSKVNLAVATIGSPIRWGWTIIKIFVRGINPLSFKPSDYDDGVMKMVAYGLTIFRIMMVVLLMLEAYSYIKNKKAT